jgi:hypothetical protein
VGKLERRLDELEFEHRAEPDPHVLIGQADEEVNRSGMERLGNDQRLHDIARVEEDLRRQRCFYALEREHFPR